MTEALVVVVVLVVVFVVSQAARNPGEFLRVRLTFPRSLTYGQAVAATRSLAGLSPPWWRAMWERPSVMFEVRATSTGIEHVLTIPASRAEFVVGALRAAMPGLRLADEAPPAPRVELVRELRRSGTEPLRTDAAPETSAGMLAALQPLRRNESAVIQYVVTPTVASPFAGIGEWFSSQLADGGREPSPAPIEPVFAIGLRLGVAAPTRPRRAQLIARVLGAIHTLNAPDGRLVRRLIPSDLAATRLRRGESGQLALAADELAAVLALPLDAPMVPGLTLARSRELPPIASVPRRGLVLGDSTVAGSTRPVAIAGAEARRGLHICAPTGAGKSTALTNLAVQLMEAKDRPGLIVIDSKGDLIADLADRIPPARRDDVLVFDPADRIAPVGFNLIGGSGEAGLIVDHVVADLRARYGAAGLGPRSEDVLRAALTTLTAHSGQYTLCEVEPLLTNPAFRQKLIGTLDDPVLQSFWAWYGSLSDAARGEVIAPLANKIRTYTLRRQVRAVIGQQDGLDLADALERGGIILASLAKGTVGADAAGLIGAAMTSRLWTAIQARASVPIASRRPATVICDEFQDFAAISPVFPDVVSQSRGYTVSWVLAHQHLAQLDRATREAVLANCRSRLVMQTTASDARAFAREFHPYLDPDDLQGLGAYEGFAAVSTGASVAPPATIRTRPAPASLDCGDAVRAVSRARYGTPPADVDAAIRARVAKARSTAPVGGARRES